MPMKNVCLAFILSCAAIAPTALASNDSALKLFSQKKFDQAQKEFMAAAETGDTKAQYLLGIGLLQGKYFPKNEQQGLRLLQASSEGGNGRASYALFQYLNQVERRPLSTTIPLLEKAAAQGDIQAKAVIDNILRSPAAMAGVYGALDSLIPIEVNTIAVADMTAAIKNGQAVFQRSCSACHQTGIAGAPMISDSARWADLRKKGFATLIEHAINGFKAHPPRGGAFDLTGDDIRDAVFFMSTPRQP